MGAPVGVIRQPDALDGGTRGTPLPRLTRTGTLQPFRMHALLPHGPEASSASMSDTVRTGTRASIERGPSGRGALLVILALIVIDDSIRVGIGWADDGPRAGYFPFYIGLMLLVVERNQSW